MQADFGLAPAERQRVWNRTVLQFTIILAIVIGCQYYVGLFDAERLKGGIPSLIKIADGIFPPNFSQAGIWVKPVLDALAMSIADTAVAVLLSTPLGVLATRNTSPHPLVYQATRGLLNVLRSISELIMDILFMAAVGFGALPGVLALGLHSVGMIAKFFSESIEHADPALVEAAHAAGCTSLQVIFHGIFLQMFPQMTDAAIYRWGYNFRASTVMDMVGAGGIGFELMGSLRIMQYQDASTILLVILGTVTLVDAFSSFLRHKFKQLPKLTKVFMKPKVVLTHWVHPEIIKLLSASADVIPNATREILSRSKVIVQAKDTDALMAFMPDSIDSAFLEECPKLRIIGAALKGYSNSDVSAYTHHDVWLTIAPDLLTIPTAELTIGLLLGLTGHMLKGDRQICSGYFQDWRPALYGSGLTGETLGIIGIGVVDRAIAQRLASFEVNLLYCDPTPLNAEQKKAWHVQRVTFDELLEEYDCVVPMVPVAAETLHLIDTTALAKVKTGNYLINAYYGSVMDENAVIAVLASEKLAEYVADVFEIEERIRADRPQVILKALLDNTAQTFFMPHLGSAIKEVRLEIERQAVINIIQVLVGEEPMSMINQPYPGVKTT